MECDSGTADRRIEDAAKVEDDIVRLAFAMIRATPAWYECRERAHTIMNELKKNGPLSSVIADPDNDAEFYKKLSLKW